MIVLYYPEYFEFIIMSIFSCQIEA